MRDQSLELTLRAAQNDEARAERAYNRARQSGDYEQIESCEGMLHNARARVREIRNRICWQGKS